MWSSVVLYVQNIRVKGSFIRNVSIASSWNVAVIISQFILSPITTRLYDPTQYGFYALFNSIVVNIALFSTLKYSDSIVVTATSQQRNNAIALSFALVIQTCILLLFVLILFEQEILSFFKLSHNSFLIYFIPLAVFFTAVLEILLIINISRKKFFNNGLAGFINGTMARSANIIYAIVMQPKSVGLIIGDFIGKLLAIGSVILSFKNFFFNVKYFFKSISFVEIKSTAVKYKSFPLYFLPSSVLIYLSGHLPLYFFQVQYGAAVVGAYALASSMLEIFNRLIPYALSPVFLQKANELKNISIEHLSERVYRLFVYMLLLAGIIFSGFALLSEAFFPIVFGNHWKMSGVFASLLAVQYAFNFVAVALSEIYNVLGRQKFLLINSIFNVLLKIVAVVVIFYLKLDAINAVLTYSLMSSIGGILLILGVFIILNFKVWKVSALLFLSLVVITLALIVNNFFISSIQHFFLWM